jgi:hypothetical protein
MSKHQIRDSLSLMGIAHLSVVMVTFGLTTQDHAELWELVQ